MKSKLYKDFWDNFNAEKYKEVTDVKNDRLEIRVNAEEKQKFQKKVGNMSVVINSFIAFINNLDHE